MPPGHCLKNKGLSKQKQQFEYRASLKVNRVCHLLYKYTRSKV